MLEKRKGAKGSDSDEDGDVVRYGDIVSLCSKDGGLGFLSGVGHVKLSVHPSVTASGRDETPLDFRECLFWVLPVLQYSAQQDYLDAVREGEVGKQGKNGFMAGLYMNINVLGVPGH